MLRRSVLLALVGLAACEFPTEAPKWEQTWVVPGESITVSVAELLPTGVDLTTDSSAFSTTAPGSSLSFSLSEMCGSACDIANGFEQGKQNRELAGLLGWELAVQDGCAEEGEEGRQSGSANRASDQLGPGQSFG